MSVAQVLLSGEDWDSCRNFLSFCRRLPIIIGHFDTENRGSLCKVRKGVARSNCQEDLLGDRCIDYPGSHSQWQVLMHMAVNPTYAAVPLTAGPACSRFELRSPRPVLRTGRKTSPNLCYCKSMHLRGTSNTRLHFLLCSR